MMGDYYDSASLEAKKLHARSRMHSLLNSTVSPDTRQRVYSNVSSFAQEQPILATFIAVQVVLSFAPLALFASFLLGTVVFAAVCAFSFVLFWAGAALLVLVPTLFVTVSLAIAVWMWAVGGFVVARWLYNRVPVAVRGGVQVELPNGKAVVVNKTGEGYGDVEAKVEG